ncbi:hypothetical protein, partial [Vibrio vulnificus]|uniref:hypothetical protein n=1 Tax=Vibrio vulnificus TaxID=672 RepID=UPI0019D494DC
GRTLFVGLIDSKTSSRFKMDPRVRKDDEQEPRAVRNFATFYIRHSRVGGNPFLNKRWAHAFRWFNRFKNILSL